MRTLIESRLRIVLPGFATPEPPERIDLFTAGQVGWTVFVTEDMPAFIEEHEVERWVMGKLAVEATPNAPAFYLASAYSLSVSLSEKLIVYESVRRALGERTLTVPVEFPAADRPSAKLVLEDDIPAERLGQFHGPVVLRVAILGEPVYRS